MDVTRAMLEKLGYRVIPAQTGREAVDTVTDFKEEIDLAVLDIQLPDMDALSVYRALKSNRPDLKVIVYSGYSVEGPAREILDAGADAFIQKPFSMQALSKKIAEIKG
jgi:CheY-like chemotaxis protein